MVEMRDNGAEARKINEAADKSVARTIYLPLLRVVTPRAIDAFDPVSQSLVSGTRESTTVPTQALFLLNSTFVREESLAYATHVTASSPRFNAEWLHDIYLSVLGRAPTTAETKRDELFLTAYTDSYHEGAPAAPQIAQSAAAPSESDTGTSTAVAGQVANPDDVDRAPDVPKDGPIQPKDARTAAWMSLIQALYASAEFRFVR